MKAKLKHLGKMRFDAAADSGHQITMDASPAVGGENAGPRPMEMVLMGLGGCSGIDVVMILKKSRQQVTGCEIELNAERADTAPKVFTRIHVHYIVTGNNLDRTKVDRAVVLSMEKYCSVTLMLRASVQITHGFEIVEEGSLKINSKN